jgi:hypothetical protein
LELFRTVTPNYGAFLKGTGVLFDNNNVENTNKFNNKIVYKYPDRTAQ